MSLENDRVYERMCKVMPAGIASNFRKDDSIPTYFNEGKGAILYDVAGREHVDYTLGFGPSIFGHGVAALNDAMHRQIDRMSTTGNNFLKMEAAECLCENIPSADLVFFNC